MKEQLMILAIMIISLSSNNLYAQDRNLGFSVNVGLPTEVTEGSGNFAISGGFTVEKVLKEKWALEGTLNGAYLSYDRYNVPLEHDGGYNSYLALSVGPRYYWNGTTAKHPIYTNVVLGGGFRLQEQYNSDDVLKNYDSAAFMLSSGTYIAVKNRIILGLHFDAVSGGKSPSMFLGAKVGVNF